MPTAQINATLARKSSASIASGSRSTLSLSPFVSRFPVAAVARPTGAWVRSTQDSRFLRPSPLSPMSASLVCCQVCQEEEPAGALYQCFAEHIFCSRCWDATSREDPRCPTCRECLPSRERPIRNRAIEQALDARPPVPCRNCGRAVARTERQTHVCDVQLLAGAPVRVELCLPESPARAEELPLDLWQAEAVMRFHLLKEGSGGSSWIDIPLRNVHRTELRLEKAGCTAHVVPLDGVTPHAQGCPSVRASLLDSSVITLPLGGSTAEGHRLWTREVPERGTYTYAGDPSAPRLKRHRDAAGVCTDFEGHPAAKRSKALPTGVKVLYSGPPGREAKRGEEFPHGAKRFFEGPAGHEAKRCVLLPSGRTFFFGGQAGHEHKLREHHPGGVRRFFEGAAGAEAKRREEHPDGTTLFFEGHKGSETLVR